MKRKLMERLKELRTEQNLSYDKLSKLTGINSTSLFNWENGLSDVTGDKLIVLAQFFKVSADYLLGLDD